MGNLQTYGNKPNVFQRAKSFVGMEDPIIDFMYHDLEPKDKLIFQHRTGYRGSPIM